jgi:hypothetical protein
MKYLDKPAGHKGVVLGLWLGLLVAGPGWAAPATAGTLQFLANGEELITEGFLAPQLTKDGWSLTFSHAYVTLAAITAYQASPPYDPRGEEEITASRRVALAGVHTVDLARGTVTDPPVLVGEVASVAAGHYNAISWQMLPATAGPAAGYSLLLIGQAQKDGHRVDFNIGSREPVSYKCGEFVGDERKGFLPPGGKADLEMTFHFDHIFGRADKDAADPMNVVALGFAPFASADQVHELNLQGLHIGHAGEGHCR